MSQRCSNGHPVAAKARFCRECGVLVTPSSETAAPTAPRVDGPVLPGLPGATVAVARVDEEPASDGARRARGPIILAIVAGVVLLLGAGAVGALLIAGSGDDNGAVPTPHPSKAAVTSTSTLPTTTTSLVPPPTSPPLAARNCVRDTTPLNLHVAPGIHGDVTGLLMVGNCEAFDPPSGPVFQYVADGGNFRRILWRGLDGWVVAGNIGSTPSPVPVFRAGSDPSCTTDAVLAGWTAAERGAYTSGDPQYRAIAVQCTGTGVGAIAYGRFMRGKLNPDGRTTEAIFRNTGSGWQELAHSGPTLLDVDLASTGVSSATVEDLRARSGP